MANENTDPRLLGQSNFYSSFCRLLLLFFLIQTIHLILHCLNCWIESETSRRTGCLDLSTSEKWEKERPRPLECSIQRQMCIYMYLFRSRSDSTRSLSFSLKIVFFSPFFRGHIIDSPCKMSAGDYWIRFSHAVICTTFPLYTSGGVRSLATPNQPYLRGNRLLWGTAANRHIIPCVKPWWLQSAIMHQVNVRCRAGGNRKTGGSWLLLCHVSLGCKLALNRECHNNTWKRKKEKQQKWARRHREMDAGLAMRPEADVAW